jgi:hypothetical protein
MQISSSIRLSFAGVARRLEHEHVLAADVLVISTKISSSAKRRNRSVGQRQLEVVGDRAGERQVRIAGLSFMILRAPSTRGLTGGSPIATAGCSFGPR